MNVIVNYNKPKGITSQQAVTRVKKLLGARKAGHAGTLDPLATGVLLICLDEATKITRFLMETVKEYRARMKLGERTDTLDAEGIVTETRLIPFLTRDAILDAVQEFKGAITQKPPMYSAIKHRGKPLYALARKGTLVDRTERMVTIHDIRVSFVELPYIDLTISCSKGTYIRTLCDDLGVRLGTFAHLVSLERTRIGTMTIEQAAQSDQLVGVPDRGPLPFMHSIDAALASFKEILLNENEYRKAKHGAQVTLEHARETPANPFVRLKSPSHETFAIGRIEDSKITIERLFHL